MLPVILRVTVDDHSTVLSMTVSRDGTAILNTWADDVDEIAWYDMTGYVLTAFKNRILDGIANVPNPIIFNQVSC
jgi:hypothetical protein